MGAGNIDDLDLRRNNSEFLPMRAGDQAIIARSDIRAGHFQGASLYAESADFSYPGRKDGALHLS